ncbi:PaaI family thioesterase [Phenylobacterium deserti]|uniref:PaaI family thioesterase n=1 Tax=Phenylobacterium deserti TaxID=1914756 RepID=A0A328AC47_9CAUL|nr:PaaI family thioesterase [Phenylobacterium deserti]RAK52057.1 PaaI family thioesterase [Phenylobacterium deserti]
MNEAESEISTPPDGFEPLIRKGAFSVHNGPFFFRPGDGEVVEQAFYALPRHANGLGLVHGGMLSAFMDGLLAAAVIRQARRPAVTIHLSVDYLHMARLGEWVMGEARLTRAGKDVAFAEGRAHVGGRDVVRASAIFKLMNRER